MPRIDAVFNHVKVAQVSKRSNKSVEWVEVNEIRATADPEAPVLSTFRSRFSKWRQANELRIRTSTGSDPATGGAVIKVINGLSPGEVGIVNYDHVAADGTVISSESVSYTATQLEASAIVANGLAEALSSDENLFTRVADGKRETALLKIFNARTTGTVEITSTSIVNTPAAPTEPDEDADL